METGIRKRFESDVTGSSNPVSSGRDASPISSSHLDSAAVVQHAPINTAERMEARSGSADSGTVTVPTEFHASSEEVVSETGGEVLPQSMDARSVALENKAHALNPVVLTPEYEVVSPYVTTTTDFETLSTSPLFSDQEISE